jgi:hypothetical protein
LVIALAMVGCAAMRPLDVSQSYLTLQGGRMQACLVALGESYSPAIGTVGMEGLAQVPDRFGKRLKHIFDLTG